MAPLCVSTLMSLILECMQYKLIIIITIMPDGFQKLYEYESIHTSPPISFISL